MSENIITYVVAPSVTAILGGVGFLVKYILNKRDEKHREEVAESNRKHEEEIEERNRRRDEIESKVSKLETKLDNVETTVKDISGIIIGCEHPDCPSRKLLAEYFKNK